MDLIHAFAPIVKTEKADDGSILVYGMATGPQLDLDGQICDPDWLKSAMPAWFESGANVREMHQPSAVGVGTELEQMGDDHWLTSKVVDPNAVLKVDTGVYQGYSIGIKAPKVVKDASAPNGRIIGGKIIEVSLVDRPCNESAKLVLAKLAGDTLVQTEDDLHKDAEAEEVDWLQAARDALANWLANEAAEVAAGTGGTYVVQLLANLLADLDWAAQVDAADDVSAAMDALKTALISPRQEEPVDLTQITSVVKAATADDAPDAAKADLAELTKTLGVDDLRAKLTEAEQLLADARSEIDTAKAETTAVKEQIDLLTAEVVKVKDTVVEVGAPARLRPAVAAQSAARRDELTSKAAHYRRMSAQVTDRNEASAYLKLADEALAELATL
jgi:hypothetical protein